MVFEITNDELSELELKLTRVATQNDAFRLTLHGFGSLTNWKPGVGQTGTPYVIYVDVMLSPTLLRLVQHVKQATQGNNVWYKMPEPYAPHITLAFRDLDEAGYTRGMDYLRKQSLNLQATIDHIALVVTHAESNTELKRILLSSSSH
jgi:2'-5' RNA ligase